MGLPKNFSLLCANPTERSDKIQSIYRALNGRHSQLNLPYCTGPSCKNSDKKLKTKIAKYQKNQKQSGNHGVSPEERAKSLCLYGGNDLKKIDRF